MAPLPVPPDLVLVQVRTQFEGYHAWPGAPEEVKFLRSTHRHMFHVEVHLQAKHEERELEFILLKRWIEQNCIKPLILKTEAREHCNMSCETMAHWIGERVREEYGNRWTCVGVFEDGENGGIVTWQR